VQYTEKCNPIRILIASMKKNESKKIINILSSQNDFRVTCIEKDEAGVIIKTWQSNPDVLILDIQPSQFNSERLAPIIHRKSPSTAIAMLCNNREENHTGRAIRAGVSGILLKDEDMDKLIPAIQIIVHGGYYISASIVIDTFKTDSYSNKDPKRITEQKHLILTQLEHNIITGLARGYSDKEIAKRLNYSEGTIKNSIVAIKRRTKLNNRIHIVVYALSNGIINMEDAVWEELNNIPNRV